MPLLGRMLEKNHGFRCTVLYARDPDGTVNPDNVKNIPGLEALKNADLMVVYLRFRQLPDDQLQHILDYANSGRPMMGFRTATHSFQYREGPNRKWNDDFGRLIFGQRWITHHGHHGDQYLTEVQPVEGKEDHPILHGVKPFKCYSWLYHVHGGKDQLHGDYIPLLNGTSLVSSHQKETDRFPLTQPVAWTKTFTGTSGKAARVFFTTLGHPYDFKSDSMRRLCINAVYWSLGLERKLPPEGANADPVGESNLSNAGVGRYIKGVKPPQP